MRALAPSLFALAPVLTGCVSAPPADPRIERAEAMTRVGAWRDAGALWNEIYLASGTRDVDAGLRSAEAFEARGELAMARSRLFELAARAPDRADVQLRLGAVLERLGEPAEARRRFERALELDPGAAEARKGFGRVTGGEEGIAALRGGLRLDPEDRSAARALGFLLAEAGQRDEAAAALGRGFEGSAADPALDGERLRAARAFGSDLRVVPWLEPVVARSPEATEALRRIGEAYLAGGRPDRALEWLRRAASSDPTDALALIGLGRARIATGAAGEPTSRLAARVRALPLTPEESAALEVFEAELAAALAADRGPAG